MILLFKVRQILVGVSCGSLLWDKWLNYVHYVDCLSCFPYPFLIHCFLSLYPDCGSVCRVQTLDLFNPTHCSRRFMTLGIICNRAKWWALDYRFVLGILFWEEIISSLGLRRAFLQWIWLWLKAGVVRLKWTNCPARWRTNPESLLLAYWSYTHTHTHTHQRLVGALNDSCWPVWASVV